MPRIALIGTGLVGSTVAYALMHRGVADELVLIDANFSRAEGEAMDLSHARPFVKNVRIKTAGLGDLAGADMAILAAGRNSLPGESRLDLLKDNAGRIRSICSRIKKWRRRPIVLVVSNPVDVLTELAVRELHDRRGVFGSGTVLDTARLKTSLGEHFSLDPHSIHGYILGEHGDSEFAAWSTVYAGGMSIRKWPRYRPREMDRLIDGVRSAAYEIIKRKRATHFGVGAAVALIAEAVLRGQNTVLPVSVSLRGQYGLSGVSLSLPCVLSRRGILRVLTPALEAGELRSLRICASVLKKAVALALATL